MCLTCPECGSEELRLSRRKFSLRKVLRVFGVYYFRCEQCGHRFQSNIYRLCHLMYAKCPLCHRMDLSRWTREYYSPPLLTRTMLALGADPVRCEYCRNNFCSFRKLRENFSKEKRAGRSRVMIPVEPPAGVPR